LLLAHALPIHERDEILGDMTESYTQRARRQGGRNAARLWYWRQAIAIPARLRWRRIRGGASSHELRQAARGLAASPAFTAIAVLSLSLGIGANTAIFSAVRSTMYTTLPVERPHELRLAYNQRPEGIRGTSLSSSSEQHPQTGVPIHSNYTYPMYERLRAAAGPEAELLGYSFAREVAVVVGDQPATSATALLASGDYFSTLRVPMAAGRPFQMSDDRPDAPRVAVISHAFWQRVFGGDPSAVGTVLGINGTPFEIVGVTGARFNGLSPGGFFAATEITTPLASQPVIAPTWRSETGSMFTAHDYYWVRVIARVAGPRQPALEDAMSVAFRGALLAANVIAPDNAELARVYLLDGSRGLDSLRREVQRPLTILAGAVAAVLLIACVNLAGLLLARGTGRQHELALRSALGASRLRLMWQLVLESLLLAAAGGALGLVLAVWGGPAIAAALTASLGQVALHMRVDWQLFGVVTLVSLVAALACALLPALRLTRAAAAEQLRGRSFGERGRFTLGKILIAAQIAVSIPLVVGAGLFLRTLSNLGDVELGFDAHDLVIFRIQPSMVTSDAERVATIYRGVLRQVEDLPGVSAATLVENALLSGWISNTGVRIGDGDERVGMYMNAVGPRYFETLGIPLVSGRTLLPTDDAGAPDVIVVNQTAERELFGGSAVGRVVRRGGGENGEGAEVLQVVGVVADSRYDTLRGETTPTFYDPYAQRGLTSAHVLVRTAIPVDRLEPTIRELVARVDAGLPVTAVRSQSEQIAVTTSRERVFARLLALFGGFALLVASIGLYGVTSFAVSRRRAEMGVRLALGARPPQVLWLVLRSVMVLTGVGLAVGLLAAQLVGPVVESMLYGLAPGDPMTLASAAAIMLAVALGAGFLPARRAARTDALIVMSRE
jgi:predicted permease